MNIFKKSTLVFSIVASAVGMMLANVGNVSSAYFASQNADDEDTIVKAASLDPDVFPQPSKGIVYAHIHALARSYGDSIVLRWAGEDYVVQRRLHNVGVTITRIDHTTHSMKEIATALKPLTKEQFIDKYPQSDSLAYMAVELLYGDAKLRPDQTESHPGTMGSLLDIHDDQQTHFGFSVLLSEWRPDLADKMAMRYVDRDVEKGHTYEYIIQPSIIPENETTPIASGHVQRITNNPYKKEKFDITIGDSITGPNTVRLWWKGTKYSSFEIDRRRDGETKWERVNKNTYLSMDFYSSGSDHFFKDVVDNDGDYEYRIFAHDAFGDITDPSATYKVHFPDKTSPNAPQLTSIVINRTDPSDLSKGVMATFHIRHDSIPEDFAGYMPLYFNERITGNEWKKLGDKLFTTRDTVFTVDVTGYTTGIVTIGAYDNSGNVSYSLPQMIRLQDAKAPSVLRNLKAETNSNNGTVRLTWEHDPADDDIEYYEVVFANDTTHSFMLRSEGMLKDEVFVDTVDMQVNQKYIYYKVRAIDYSTNEGPFTPVLQVIRPSNLIPSKAHLDSAWVSKDGINMRWACGNDQQLSHHILYRKLDKEGPKMWKVMARYDADSLTAAGNLVTFTDNPVYTRRGRYTYSMESFSCNGLSSGKSLAYSVRWEGPMLFNWNIKLEGEFNVDDKITRLAWETDTENLPLDDEWYFCVYRKTSKDARPVFVTSVESTDRYFEDRTIRNGESASYYVFIQCKDGRKSSNSNVLTVKAPMK